MPKPNVISTHTALGAAVSEHQASIIESIITAVERLDGEHRRMVDVQTLQGLQQGPGDEDYDCIVIIRIIEQINGMTGVTAVGTMTRAGIALDSNNKDTLAILRETIEMSVSVDPERSIIILDKDDVRRIKEERDSA